MSDGNSGGCWVARTGWHGHRAREHHSDHMPISTKEGSYSPVLKVTIMSTSLFLPQDLEIGVEVCADPKTSPASCFSD